MRLGPLVKGLPGWKPHHKSEITIKFFCFFHSNNVIYYGMQNLPCKCVFTFIGPWKQKYFDELLWFTMCYFSSKRLKKKWITKKMYRYVEGGLAKIIALQMVTFIDPWKQVFWRAITSLKCAIFNGKKRERLVRTKVTKKVYLG